MLTREIDGDGGRGAHDSTLAEAYGIEGHNVFDRETAARIIPEAIAAKRPVLLNFVVYESEKVFPMIPAGAGVDEMIIGDQEPDEREASGKVGS